MIKNFARCVLVLTAAMALASGGSGTNALTASNNERTVCSADFSVSAGEFPYFHTGDLSGVNTPNRCGLRRSNEHIYRILITTPANYTFSTCGSGQTDTYLDLRTDCCAGDEIARNDDGCGMLHGPASLECISLDAGVYYLIVEAGSPAGEGPYQLQITSCGMPCEPPPPDGLYPFGDGLVGMIQTVDSTTHDKYDGPYVNSHGCVNGQPLYGFDYLSWYDNDFGWTHEMPAGMNYNEVCIQFARLYVCGWDVDFSDCTELADPSHCERDVVSMNGVPLATVEDDVPNLIGSNHAWSQTVFNVPIELLSDYRLHVTVDFDQHRNACEYAGLIHQSVLVVAMRPNPCNSAPYPPILSQSQCTTPDSQMCVTVTGPNIGDPDEEPVWYSYQWYHGTFANNYALMPSLNDTLPCHSAANSAIGDVWLVKVRAHDAGGLMSDEVSSDPFVVMATCGDNNLVSWDYGDLDTTCYHITGTQETGGPANAIRDFNIAWLGEGISRDTDPRIPNQDTNDDGVTFIGRQWQPCSEVCIDVQVTAGPGYMDQPLFLYGWKDGNLNCSFLDTLCSHEAPECFLAGVPIEGLHAGHDSVYHFCFVDPGVTDMGVYNGVFRFRLLSRSLPVNQALTFVDSLLGETEDYIKNDLQLAVELQSFAASFDGNGIDLTWTTATEQNSDHFFIERRAGGSWTRLDARITGAGSSTSTRTYHFRDESAGLSIGTEYRLIAVDVNGTSATLGSAVSSWSPGAQPVNDFRLYSAYPNPFNPTTNIAFDIKEAGHVSIMVYDVTGRAVATLVDGNRVQGHYQITFDAAGLPSGLYLYRMTTPGFSSIQKMILLK
jgi:hypothetical protein